jgi:hypothetical protein
LADAGEGHLITCIGGGRGEARQNFTDIPFLKIRGRPF